MNWSHLLLKFINKSQKFSFKEKRIVFMSDDPIEAEELQNPEQTELNDDEPEDLEVEQLFPERPDGLYDLTDWREKNEDDLWRFLRPRNYRDLVKIEASIQKYIDEGGKVRTGSSLYLISWENRRSITDSGNKFERDLKDILRGRKDISQIKDINRPEPKKLSPETEEFRQAVATGKIRVRRFLKNSHLLLDPEYAESSLEDIYTDWERAIIDLNDIDEEIELLLKGRKLYVGSEEKEAELDNKADFIAAMQVDLDEDIHAYEKTPSSDPETDREIRSNFVQRQKRIEILKNEKKESMLHMINIYIEGLEKKRRQFKLKVLDKMFSEFESRVDRLIEEWGDIEAVPEEYKHNQPKAAEQLRNMKKFLADFKPLALEQNDIERHSKLASKHSINDFLDEDLSAMRAFDMQLDNCEMRSNAKADDLSQEVENEKVPTNDEIEQEYISWQEKYAETQAAVEKINTFQAPVIDQLKEIKNSLIATPLSEFTGEKDEDKQRDKDERIEMMERNIAAVSGESMDMRQLDNECAQTDKELVKWKADIQSFDPNKITSEKERRAATISNKAKRRSYKEAVSQSKKYFDSIISFATDLDGLTQSVNNYLNKQQEVESQKAEADSIDISVRWLAGNDVMTVFNKMKEWSDRRWQRASDDRVGEVGSKLFDIPGLSITKNLANEFDKIRESAEQGEVNQYKEAYANKDSWQIQEVMENTKNQDEFKATLYLLSENGRLRFDNENLWKQLEFFQDTISFVDDYSDYYAIETLKSQPTVLHDKLHKAIGYLWDFDTYYDFKNTQDSAYENKKSEWKRRCDQIAEVEGGGLTMRAKELLSEYKRDKKKGLVPKVNPHEYEAIIEYCIEFGKMSGEEKIYFLIQGIDCGLLEYPDRMLHFDSKQLNEYPALEVLASATGGGKTRPSREDIRNWAKIDGDKNTPGDDFYQWFWTYVHHSPRVLQRADKTLSQGTNRMDHDDVTASIAFVESSTIKQMLKLSYGGEYGLPATGFANMAAAYLQYVDNWAKNAEYIDNSVEHLKRFINAFSTYYAVTRGQMWKKKDYFRFSETALNDPNGPRAGGMYATHATRGITTTKDYMEKTKDLMSVLDKELFTRLFDEKLASRTDEGKKYLTETVAWIKQRYGKPNIFGAEDPKTYDELMDTGLSKIVEVIMKGAEGKQRMKKFIEAVRQDIETKVGDSGLRNFQQILDETGYKQDNFPEIHEENLKALPVAA